MILVAVKDTLDENRTWTGIIIENIPKWERTLVTSCSKELYARYLNEWKVKTLGTITPQGEFKQEKKPKEMYLKELFNNI